MTNECNIARDLLPLYLENMLSDESSAFVKEHLEGCSECSAEFEKMKAGTKVEQSGVMQAEKGTTALIAVKKKLRKKTVTIVSIVAACIIGIVVLLNFFPIYRLAQIWTDYNFYTGEQIAKALYIGSASDRREAQAVLRVADKAFHDTHHTAEENEQEYGLLARYATDVDSYPNASFNEYSLELWSAHLGKEEGWIWVYYSSETFNHDGSTARGSWNIPSLWKVEKNDAGEWVVVQIREHP